MALAAVSMGLLGLAGTAFATQINTGGKKGAYHGQFCPALKTALDKAHFKYDCKTSKGSMENLARVKENPTQIGFSQFDVFALEYTKQAYSRPFTAIRSDVARECIFLVTKNPELENFGQVSAKAGELSFILPPIGSGSAATFDFLRQIDPDGLGLAQNVTHAGSTEEALEKALSEDGKAVSLFVQFPDPGNSRFKTINKLEGHFVPVIDRTVLRQQIDGEKVYFAQETEVSNPKLWKSGEKVVTACTPLVLFTGDPKQMPVGQAQQDQEDLINTIRAVSAEELQPKKGFFKTLWNKTKAVSADAVEKLMDASEKAREAATPYIEKAKEKAVEAKEKAKELGTKAVESAGPALEKAKEGTKNLYEKAKEGTKEMIDTAKEKVGGSGAEGETQGQ